MYSPDYEYEDWLMLFDLGSPLKRESEQLKHGYPFQKQTGPTQRRAWNMHIDLYLYNFLFKVLKIDLKYFSRQV